MWQAYNKIWRKVQHNKRKEKKDTLRVYRVTDDLCFSYYLNFTTKFYIKKNSSPPFHKLENRELGRLSNFSKVACPANVEQKCNSLSILLPNFYLHTIAFQNKDIKVRNKGKYNYIEAVYLKDGCIVCRAWGSNK